MRVPEKYYDEVFAFKGQWDVPSRCGLRIIRQREKTIVIVTELYQDNPGTSITAAGKSLAAQICFDKGLELDTIMYIECNPDTNSKFSFYDEKFFEVSFPGNAKPVYRQLDSAEVRNLCEPDGSA